jgi:hypothetical protein
LVIDARVLVASMVLEGTGLVSVAVQCGEEMKV